jgi:hypothetical protein
MEEMLGVRSRDETSIRVEPGSSHMIAAGYERFEGRGSAPLPEALLLRPRSWEGSPWTYHAKFCRPLAQGDHFMSGLQGLDIISSELPISSDLHSSNRPTPVACYSG